MPWNPELMSLKLRELNSAWTQSIHYCAMAPILTCRCLQTASPLEPSGDTTRAAWRAAEWISEFRLASSGEPLPPNRYLRAAVPALTRETVDGEACLWAQVCRSQRKPDGAFELPLGPGPGRALPAPGNGAGANGAQFRLRQHAPRALRFDGDPPGRHHNQSPDRILHAGSDHV